MGPTYKIAEMLKISYIEATKYCEDVRSRSELGSSLSYKVIAHYLAENLHEAPSSQRLAEIIKRYGAVATPIKKVKIKKIKPLPPSAPRRWNISRAMKKEKRAKSRFERPTKPSPLPTYLVRTSYFDQERVSEQKLEHCPHGVPHGRVCAICDPKKFREMTGMD